MTDTVQYQVQDGVAVVTVDRPPVNAIDVSVRKGLNAAIDRATADGCTAIVMHSTPWMTTAHRIYARYGFERDKATDWTPVPGIDLWGFRLEL